MQRHETPEEDHGGRGCAPTHAATDERLWLDVKGVISEVEFVQIVEVSWESLPTVDSSRLLKA